MCLADDPYVDGRMMYGIEEVTAKVLMCGIGEVASDFEVGVKDFKDAVR